MNISQAARQSGLTAKALRYYESIGLLSPDRSENGYRAYGGRDLETLRFIQRARAVGFAVDEVRCLLGLHRDPARRSHDAKLLVQEKLTRIEDQLRNLCELRANLRGLADSCAGNESPKCAILDSLSGGGRE